ncbi:5-deoxy-glucuronate isomerase [Shewanella sp.]|uniref:5-deoxy-glucuronate isomerase n=1 Tax=Shewanella sp. TaxID=50422 RepID=UPI001EC12FF8|nr:5-deoxy-glucuronate isomerase [Shewanella sp.]NRB23850.1 5-deoxy-glucuronate isomerase [Shewanella sp.]
MSHLLVHSGGEDSCGCVVRVTPESANWRYVGFAVHKLARHKLLTKNASEQETCIVILSGKVNFLTLNDEGREVRFDDVGERNSVFDPMSPYAIYVPAGIEYQIESITPAEIALCTAPGDASAEVRLITPQQISVEQRGQGSNSRLVRNILPENERAESLLIAEVITPSGNWSSYPPHKHDTDNLPQESALEETYYHRLNPPQGFAFQRVYTDDLSVDETMTVVDGDVVMVPEGYHPVGVPHGYDLYYLNVMAGPKRAWVFANDPEHDWIAKQ